jgi:hypothetical protein
MANGFISLRKFTAEVCKRLPVVDAGVAASGQAAIDEH